MCHLSSTQLATCQHQIESQQQAINSVTRTDQGVRSGFQKCSFSEIIQNFQFWVFRPQPYLGRYANFVLNNEHNLKV